MALVNGTFVPLATPFTDDGRALSEVRMSRQVRFWLEQGAKGFYIAGETGEFTTIVSSERKAMLEIVHRECQGTVPIVANVSSLSTAMSLDLAQHAARHGATGAFLSPPFFGRFTRSEIVNHMKTVVGLAGLPVIAADLFGSSEEGFDGALATLPQVEFAAGTGFDEWKSEGASVHAIMVLAALYPEADKSLLGRAYLECGPAPLVKAGFDRLGIELGSPRSPKNAIDPPVLAEMLKLAA